MSAICHHTMSLDGFIAGPDDSIDSVFAHGEATALAAERAVKWRSRRLPCFDRDASVRRRDCFP